MRTRALAVLVLVAVAALAACSSPPPRPPTTDAALKVGDAGATAQPQPDAGPPCVPTPERCNGLDDDCDGRADNGFALFVPCESRCVNGVGYAGRAVCDNDGDIVCEPAAGWRVCH